MKELRCDTWQGFRDFVIGDQQAYPVYWRGQRDPAWPLASSFERYILKFLDGWKEGASQIYPYDGRYYDYKGEKILTGEYIREMRDGYLPKFCPK